MAIITISRGSYSRGKDVAEKVAARLGYECISRDILLEAAGQFNLPEIKLVRALHDAPSILDRFTYGKEKYIAYITSAFLDRAQQDNVVYHGLAGHFFLKGVQHVLKVRIVSDFEDRVRLEMERENISREEAARILKRDDEERRRWSMALYGVDTHDPSLYDLVLHIKHVTVDDAVDIICRTVGLDHFKTTLQSRKILDDLALSARLKARLAEKFPRVQVVSVNGFLTVTVAGPLNQEERIIQEVASAAANVDGINALKVNVTALE